MNSAQVNQEAAQHGVRLSVEDMDRLGVPLIHRNACVHLYVDLDKCRKENGFAMTKCGEQRHAFDQCIYQLFLKGKVDTQVERMGKNRE